MAVWDLLAEGRSPRKYHAGQMVYLQGARPECFYYLISGSVRSFISSGSGEERVLAVHRSGDLMGEASFFDGCPRVTSAMALEDCRILTIDRAQLDAAFQRHPELALPMLQYLARTVRMLSDHVESSSLPAQQRVARWLLGQPGVASDAGRNTASVSTTGRGGSIRATHEGIGQAVGLSRVTVSRVLGELAAQGLVELGYRSIYVLDRAQLEDMAFE
ncbi:MAG: Crp/Fnr family transcriptional regulator, partial [Clostridiales bacterium]|nr:Crp/Fnr family transcriptional regulator [Clostridiales bacterium]